MCQNVNETLFLRLCFVAWVRLKLLEQQASLLSFLFVARMDCALPLWAVCRCVSAQWTASWSIIFSSPMSVALSLWNAHSFSGHSFFPGFYVIVFRKKDLVAHPEPDQRPHRVLPTWEQHWVCERRMCGGPTVQDGEGRSRQKQSYDANAATITLLLLFLTLFQSLHLSLSSLSSHPVFVRHILPKISSTVSCRRDVLATISRV